MTTPEGVDRALWLTAVHEAGHAVAAAVRGVRVHSVSVVTGRRLGDTAGRVFWIENGAPPRKTAVATLAGAEAARWAGDARAYVGAGGDLEAALADRALPSLAFGMVWGGPLFGYVAEALGDLERARGEAAELVAVYWPELTAGAAALCRAGTMSGAGFLEAAGGRLAGLDTGDEGAAAVDEGPRAAELVPVADCVQCGWELAIPGVAYRAMTGETLAGWLAWQRPRLCRSHDEW